jgi:hypothetical protein
LKRIFFVLNDVWISFPHRCILCSLLVSSFDF